MSRWSVFSSADDALVRVGKQAGMVTISPVELYTPLSAQRPTTLWES